jgi:hypothetical protein
MSLKDLRNFVCPKKQYPKDYNKTVIEAIKTITINNYDFLLFGSAVFKSLIYAGDIDINQHLPITKISTYMKDVIKKIIKKGYIIGDIKAGIKYQYSDLLKALGEIKNGVVVGYNSVLFKKLVENHNLQIDKIPDNYYLSINKWIDLHEIIHNIITLRWTPRDILNGYVINDNIKYYLDDVIKHCYNHGLNKIDMYFVLDNRIIEMTNVYEPEQKIFNIPDALKSIKINMIKYLTPKFLNYPKALKRAYTVARIEGNATLLNKIKNFLTSDINYIASLNVDINVILDILDSDNYLNDIKNTVVKHLNNLIIRMSKLNMTYYINLLKIALKYIDNEDVFIEMLTIIKNEILTVVNNMTLKYMKEYEINLNYLFP